MPVRLSHSSAFWAMVERVESNKPGPPCARVGSPGSCCIDIERRRGLGCGASFLQKKLFPVVTGAVVGAASAGLRCTDLRRNWLGCCSLLSRTIACLDRYDCTSKCHDVRRACPSIGSADRARVVRPNRRLVSAFIATIVGSRRPDARRRTSERCRDRAPFPHMKLWQTTTAVTCAFVRLRGCLPCATPPIAAPPSYRIPSGNSRASMAVLLL